jgi:hypothetical protein
MGIRSKPFEGVVLSGKDISRFERQIRDATPSAAARETVRCGLEMHASRDAGKHFSFRIESARKGS